ncbi:MAG: hypothetical protein IPI58_01100 [Alphaproteobacteria bacterium]|nr:MAG: hypothetical protein IPI58_01100 [Alphaproteobacteria bacterium]
MSEDENSGGHEIAQRKSNALPTRKPSASQALDVASSLTRAVHGHAKQMQSTPAAMIYGLASGVMIVLAVKFMIFDGRPVAGMIMMLPSLVLAGFCWHYMKNN